MAPKGKLGKARRKRDRDKAESSTDHEASVSAEAENAPDSAQKDAATATASAVQPTQPPAAARSKRMKTSASTDAAKKGNTADKESKKQESATNQNSVDTTKNSTESGDATESATTNAATETSQPDEPNTAPTQVAKAGESPSTGTAAVASKPPAKKASKPPAKKRPPRKSWDDRLLELLEFKKENGNCLVPTRFKANPQLGKWVHNQREQYKLFHQKTKPDYKKKCSMTEHRMKRLEEVGFAWTTERSKKQNEDWHARFEQLKEYQKQFGNCMVPHGYVPDPSLYEWVHRQRVLHSSFVRSGKPMGQMIKERMDLLKTIGFSFAKQDDVWKERLSDLREYKEKNGNCEVPTHFPENPALGRWVISQRYEYRKRSKGKKSVITQARIDLLNELGFNWAVGKSRDRVTWKSRYDELVDFQKKEGHMNVPADQNPQLHRWCREQKQRLRLLQKNGGTDLTKRMGPDRVELLQSIGFAEEEHQV